MFQPQLGLKAASDPAQVMDRLRHRPQVFEFFTTGADFTASGLNHLRKMIGLVQEQGVKQIVLHQPMTFEGHHAELITPQDRFPALYDFVHRTAVTMIQLAKETGTLALVHGSYDNRYGFDEMLAAYPDVASAQAAAFEVMDRLQELGGDHVVFENSISPVFYYGNPELEDQILARGYRLACDTSHTFIANHASNEVLIASLNHLRPAIAHYHLVDSMGQTHDSLQLGKGKIDWHPVLPTLNPAASAIYEINLADQGVCTEQLASHDYLQEIARELGD